MPLAAFDCVKRSLDLPRRAWALLRGVGKQVRAGRMLGLGRLRISQGALATCMVACLLWASLHPAMASLAAPSVSGASGVAWLELCTSVGVELVQVSGDATADLQGSGMQEAGSAHCPLCRAMGGLLADWQRSDLRFAAPDQAPTLPLKIPRPVLSVLWVVRINPARAPPPALGAIA